MLYCIIDVYTGRKNILGSKGRQESLKEICITRSAVRQCQTPVLLPNVCLAGGQWGHERGVALRAEEPGTLSLAMLGQHRPEP